MFARIEFASRLWIMSDCIFILNYKQLYCIDLESKDKTVDLGPGYYNCILIHVLKRNMYFDFSFILTINEIIS